ncbi:MAG TPA: GNAT family N-acetyltransferase [Candidatus Binatia bacterium]|nr:GNAT family N-acetyltransferase [Candidatus Binatia bacterium]
MRKWFPLPTPRLLLREFVAADEADVHEYGSDLGVTEYTDWGPNTPAQTHDRITGYLREQQRWPRAEVSLAAELRAERKVIGTIRLSMTAGQARAADLGFVFNRRYWNQGYATEATSAVVEAAFAALGLDRVWATCDVRNIASWRVMEKVGMHREGFFQHDVRSG